jgi:hypothetical protein
MKNSGQEGFLSEIIIAFCGMGRKQSLARNELLEKVSWQRIARKLFLACPVRRCYNTVRHKISRSHSAFQTGQSSVHSVFHDFRNSMLNP